MSDVTRISSIGLFRWGYSYLIAGNILLESSCDVLYPRLFMYSHAIELGLKAFIFDKSAKLIEGHDLVKLANEAKKYEFIPTETFNSIMKTLTNLNKDDHRIRYFKQGILSFPNNQILFQETNSFYDFLIVAIDGANRVSVEMSKEKKIA